MSAALPGRIDGARVLPVLPVLVAALALVVGAGCAAKQPARSFVDLQQRLHSGNTVYVIDDTGHETKGRVVDVSPSALTLDVDGISRRMEQDRIRQVQRYGDSLWNGVLIGMAAATPGLLIADPAYRPCTDNPSRPCADAQAGQRVLAIGLMGAIGGGIDWLIRGRRQVYLAPGQVLQSSRPVVVSPGVGPTATFTGTIIDAECARGGHAAMHMGPTDAECVRACVLSHDAAYVLEDGANVYILSDQKTPARFAARKVEVIGTLDPKTRTIAVESIAAAR